MTCNDDAGDLAVVVDSHEPHDHDTIGSMGDAADSEQHESRGEPFSQCMDREEEHATHDAEAEFFPGSDEDEEDGSDDVRHSFATAVGDHLSEEEEDQTELDIEDEEDDEDTSRYDYGMWMEETEAVSVQERRRRLLHGMGLASSRDLLRSRNARTVKRIVPPHIPRSAPPRIPPSSGPDVAPPSTEVGRHRPGAAAALTRCRSDSRLAPRGGVARKPQAFRRVRSLPHSMHQGSPVQKEASRCPPILRKEDGNGNGSGGFKNLNHDRKEFTANGQQFTDHVHRSVQMSADEYDRLIGYAPLVNQLMRRSQSQPVPPPSSSSSPSANKDDSATKPVLKKRARWLKNIKLRLINEKHDKQDAKNATTTRTTSSSSSSRGPPPPATVSMSKSASAHAAAPPTARGGQSAGPERLKVHHYGKPSKELTGLYMRQQLHAHEGSIWAMKFSADARMLATGGEDRVVRVWRVLDAGADAAREVGCSAASLVPPMPEPVAVEGRPGLAAQLSRKVRRGRSSKHVLPEHVVIPEQVFAIDERPACAFEGHQDDVLDLSWSKSQQLLSSSMDKTVRLWDMDTQTCLKLFAHNDYVTCVQFNPVDDEYFISGSLDNKVRIWSVPDRQVVDWSDLNDMVTAACYTPDGQAAIIGSHKGSCRFYKTTDCKLNQEAQIDMSISKKRKSQAKKITGFQFAPGNPSEILVTSADSQIRVFNGITVLQKFKGFKNTSSQISASYAADGRYVVCASEDSHVYLWRRGGVTPGSGGRGVGTTGGIGVRAKTWLTSRSYEYFFCRDVSVALPWPGSPPFQPCAASRSASVHGCGSTRSDNGDVDTRRPRSGPMMYSSGNDGKMPPLAALPRRDLSTRWHGGAEDGNAWGMVVVTASRGGEIRVYQNFGLPLGVKGQSNLLSSAS